MEYFTVEEFAKKIKMSEYTVRKAIREKWLFAIRPSMGKKSPYRIPESELERLQIMSMCKKGNEDV